MAFLPPEEQNQNAPTGQTTANPGMMPPPTAGGSAGAGSAPKVGAAPSSGTSTQFGSSSSKLGDYLSANAPQIQGQADKVASNLGQQYQQVGTDINNSLGQFGQTVNQGYTAGNKDLVDKAASNTQSFVQDPNNVSGFQAQYNDAYKGPQSYESTTPYVNTQNEVNNAVQTAQGFNTQGGLANYFGSQGGNQTHATNTLDALLTQGNTDARNTVSTAVDQFNNLIPQLAQSAQAGNAHVQSAQNAADAARAYAQNAINGQNGTATNLNNEVNNGYNTALTNATNQNQSVQDLLANRLYNPTDNAQSGYGVSAISDQDAASLGMTPDQAGALRQAMIDAGTSQYMTGHNFGQGSDVSKINLSQFLQQSDPSAYINQANTATPEEYAQAQALQTLTGSGDGLALNPGQASLAGTAPTNFNQFDSSAALQNAQNTAAAERGDAQAQANQLTAQADAAHNASKSHTLGSNLLNKVVNPLGQYLANPLALLPNEISSTKTAAKKI